LNRMPNNKQLKGNNGKSAMPSSRRMDPAGTVESVVNRALKNSADKMGFSNIKALVDCIKKGDPTACSYCHYNVAKELGEVLGIWDKDIKAVYAFGYDDNTTSEECYEDMSPSTLVHMIIWVGRKTNALKALGESMDRAMVQHQRRLLGLKELEHALDIQIIDDDDVKNRKGYAALLKSIYQTPVQVWISNPTS